MRRKGKAVASDVVVRIMRMKRRVVAVVVAVVVAARKKKAMAVAATAVRTTAVRTTAVRTTAMRTTAVRTTAVRTTAVVAAAKTPSNSCPIRKKPSSTSTSILTSWTTSTTLSIMESPKRFFLFILSVFLSYPLFLSFLFSFLDSITLKSSIMLLVRS